MNLWKITQYIATSAVKLVESVLEELNPQYHYVLIRSDLPLGTQLAQCIHAAGESSPANLSEHTRAVALHVPSESELLELEGRLKDAQIHFNAIREPDMGNQLMAIGIKPGPKTAKIKQLLGKLKLAK